MFSSEAFVMVKLLNTALSSHPMFADAHQRFTAQDATAPVKNDLNYWIIIYLLVVIMFTQIEVPRASPLVRIAQAGSSPMGTHV